LYSPSGSTIPHRGLDRQSLLRCVSKKDPDIIDCSLKKDYQILITFGTNISDTTDHQMIILIFHLTQRLLLHYLGKTEQAK